MLASLLVLTSACAQLRAGGATDPATATQWTFTVVRHAERADDGTDDPPLTAEGQARAERLGQRLAAQHGVAALATHYRRTQATAAPTAGAWGVGVSSYDGAADPTALVASIKRAYPQGAILVVGHSDTVPAIVATLCSCPPPAIEESEFGNLFTIRLDAAGGVLEASQVSDY
jgi:broad specificity phosphatase PhoE